MISKNRNKYLVTILIAFLLGTLGAAGAVFAKATPRDDFFKRFSLPDNRSILQNLIPANDTLKSVRALPVQKAMPELMRYLKQKAATRYYFNWRNFRARIQAYFNTFPQEKQRTLRLAREMMERFPASPAWQLPMKDRHGQLITAYQFRHLARQSKLPQVVLSYYLQNKEQAYLNYFLSQVRSLNKAFQNGKVEEGGNAVYEVFRAGKRMHHWLFAHFAFLSDKNYTWQDQLLLLRTFLHHGAILFAETKKYHPGNHQTRGLVALFEISALFPEFKPCIQWRKHALNLLLEHIKNEVNADGLQFERSEHYHKGDIENYLRVYQLAKLNHIVLPAEFEEKFKAMFNALAQLALPDENLPVLQDDTDGGSDVEADLKEPMAVGAMVFSDGLFRYFAGEKWPQSFYWLLTNKQLQEFKALPKQAPKYGSLALMQTGYYVMRDGWDKQSNYMIISAGLEKRKPDHQHGDMLGIIGFSHETMVLPNYKVHYNHPDYSYLKNSWAKNVALVDSQTQGRDWLANRGGSGFGKWKILPEPKVVCWQRGDSVDYFLGSHNGFWNLGVRYFRDVLFVKHHFWLVVDRFLTNGKHIYQQVWQGKFKRVNARHLSRTLKDGTEFHLIQLRNDAFTVNRHLFGEHQNNVFQIPASGNYDFITLIFPGELVQRGGSVFASKRFTFEQATEWSPSAKVHFKLQALIRKKQQPYLLIGVNAIRSDKQVFSFTQPIHLLIVNKQSHKLTLRFYGSKQSAFEFNATKPPACGGLVQIKI